MLIDIPDSRNNEEKHFFAICNEVSLKSWRNYLETHYSNHALVKQLIILHTNQYKYSMQIIF